MVLLVAAGTAAVVRAVGRRQARLDAVPRPALGSPAQVWLARGERVVGEIRAVAPPAFELLVADAEDVITELHTAADRVARLDQALSRTPTGDLQGPRTRLLARMEASVRGLEHARDQVTAIVIDPGVRSVTGYADERLAVRVAGLRAGLAEVRRLATPVDGQGLS